MKTTSDFTPQQFKRAVKWFVLLQSESCSQKDHENFALWLDKNASHRAAYVQAENFWANMDELKFVPIPSLDSARQARPQNLSLGYLTAWATIIFSVALGTVTWLEFNAKTTIYTTQIGEHKRIELADNSLLDLNTNSSVSVKMSLLQRHVELIRGEAQFNVIHNRLRPFEVQVGDLNIRDIGTVFNVFKFDKGASIAVLEGEVELNNERTIINEPLSAGSQRQYSENKGLGQIEQVQTQKLSGWLNGHLVFNHAPLAEVMAELERYHSIKFLFLDKKLANETLSGTFDSSDLNPFLHALERMLPVQTKRVGQNIELRRVVR
ncbi:MAG: FecR domain-containing protein [Methylococcales bacterium]|nr:FecR domain-containing protein [Methylococcales bacterium]